MDGAPSDDWHPDTWLVAGGRDAGPGDPLNVPPVLASTFVADGAHSYTRVDGSPTLEALEALVGRLEGGTATAFGSGMAACSAVLDQVPAESHLVLPGDCYHGVAGLADDGMARGRWTVDRLPVADADAWVAAAPAADVLWLESPSNPLLEVADLAPICAAGHASDALVVVDNTFATPLNQRPLEFGADVVVHSATKFIGGHGTSIGGVVVESGRFDWGSGRFPQMTEPTPGYNELRFWENFGEFAFCTKLRAEQLRDVGASLSPFNAFLLLQGLETLPQRMDEHVANAQRVAEFLDGHDGVGWVAYAGLPDSPYHDLAQRYLPQGPGAIFTFGVAGGREAGARFIESLQLVSHLANVGDARTLVIHPASTTHQQLSDEDLEAGGITPDMVRLSVGLEDVEDVLYDLDRALGRARA